MRRAAIPATVAALAAALALAAIAPGSVPAAGTAKPARSSTTAQNARILGVTPALPPYYFEYQLMGQGNVKNLRMPIFWEDLQPTADGGYNFAELDKAVVFAAINGVRLQPFVMGVPSWLGAREDRFYPPINSLEYIKGWRALLTALEQRYGPGGSIWQLIHSQAPQIKALPIVTWQIWNETNAWTYWHPRPTAARDYASFLKISARTIHRHDKDAEIVLSGLFENPSDGSTMRSFLNRLYAVPHITRSFDAVAIHPYSSNISGVVRQIREARGIMRRNGDPDAELWIDELGWPTQTTSGSGVLTKTEPEQAGILTHSFRLILRNRDKWNIGRLDWYTWRDDPAFTTCDQCAWSGLFRQDGTAKPSWTAFTKLTGGTAQP